MRVNSILVLCVGNICRSPVGERLLARALPGLVVTSAGIAAVSGAPADATMTRVAEAAGLSLEGHVARQFTSVIGAGHDLILTMEAQHRREVMRLAPHLSGRVMPFDQWTGAAGIPDPYRAPIATYEAVYRQIADAAAAWAVRLAAPTGGA